LKDQSKNIKYLKLKISFLSLKTIFLVPLVKEGFREIGFSD